MSPEHRLQKRVAKNLLAKIATSTAEFFGFVQDVASTGLGFNCNRKLEVGSDLQIQLNVPKESTMNLTGKVAWLRELPTLSKSKFQVGAALTDPPENYTKFVTKLLKREYERRESPRFSDILEIQSTEVLDLLDAAVADVSAEGLYIRTGRPLPMSAQYEIALLNKEDLIEPLYCLGEVVASFECDPDDLDLPYGAGIKIISFVGGDGERFTEYIKNLGELYQFHWPEEAPAAPPAEEPPTEEDIPIE